jgi:hypothetical protein
MTGGEGKFGKPIVITPVYALPRKCNFSYCISVGIILYFIINANHRPDSVIAISILELHT